jgi:hypothetical protein
MTGVCITLLCKPRVTDTIESLEGFGPFFVGRPDRSVYGVDPNYWRNVLLSMKEFAQDYEAVAMTLATTATMFLWSVVSTVPF